MKAPFTSVLLFLLCFFYVSGIAQNNESNSPKIKSEIQYRFLIEKGKVQEDTVFVLERDYNALGKLISNTDYINGKKSKSWKYQYDEAQILISKTYQIGEKEKEHKVQLELDPNGNALVEIFKYQVIAHQLDANGNTSRSIHYAIDFGSIIAFSVNDYEGERLMVGRHFVIDPPFKRIKKHGDYVVDDFLKSKEFTTATPHIWAKYGYDEAGICIRIERLGEVDHELAIEELTYNEGGKLIEIKYFNRAGKATANGHVRYTYFE